MLRNNRKIKDIKRMVSLLLICVMLTNNLYGCGKNIDAQTVNAEGNVISGEVCAKINGKTNEKTSVLNEKSKKVSNAFEELKVLVLADTFEGNNQEFDEQIENLVNELGEMSEASSEWSKSQEKIAKNFSKETKKVFKERTKEYEKKVEENKEKAEDVLTDLSKLAKKVTRKRFTHVLMNWKKYSEYRKK